MRRHQRPLGRELEHVDAFIAALPRGQLLLPLVAPAFNKLFETESRTAAHIAVLRITIALEKHKAAKGEYPADLAGLGGLGAGIITTDPWNDQGLRYTKTATGYDLSSAEADAR